MSKSRIDVRSIPNENCKTGCNKNERKDITEDDLCTGTVSVVDGLPVRCVGSWAIQKIYHLNQYFGIFTVGMKTKWEGNINYIEICSGPGRCIDRQSGDEFNGTPMCIVEHAAYQYINKALFFDYNKTVIEVLNARIAERKVSNAKALWGDYNNPTEICQNILKETNNQGLNLVFIDPTDCSVPFSLLSTLKKNFRNIDFIVNFAIRTDVNRNIKNAILLPETHQAVLDKYKSFLGSDSFFNDPTVLEAAKNGNHLELRIKFRQAYIDSLKRIGCVFFDFKQIENYYDLVFATSHEKGIEFWQKANSINYVGDRTLF